MKNLKKFASLLLALVMVFSLATTVSAAESATITIENASKGETYSIVKLFDATVTGEADGSIAYTGEIPEALATYFTKDDAGNITATAAAKGADGALSAEAVAAMTEWAKGQTATASKTADGSAVVFPGLEYGYYVVLTTQGSAITVDSTNPNATIYDKNTTDFTVDKEADGESYSIGDTVTYAATFDTTNWIGTVESARQVYRYVIDDTLPEFLSNVEVKSITVGGTAIETQQFDETTKSITIAWVDENGNSLYNNGAKLVLTYTATLTDKAVIDGEGNTNTITIQPFFDDNTGGDKKQDKEVIYTYAAALLKVDDNKAPLAGAKFSAAGLEVVGSAGNYTVVKYPSETTTVMETDSEGKLIIKGLASDVSLTVTETEAPAGYNKLADSITLEPTKISETVTVTYYNEDGSVSETETSTIKFNDALKAKAIEVVNNKGLELPSTGGMGTTLFYTIGGILVLAAVVLLATKKRMAK